MVKAWAWQVQAFIPELGWCPVKWKDQRGNRFEDKDEAEKIAGAFLADDAKSLGATNVRILPVR